MIRKCINCNEEMTDAWLNTGVGAFILEEQKNVFTSRSSDVLVKVCPKCGHVELVAENPEFFKK